MNDYKTIYCPKCGRRVANWDGRSKINVIANCKKCKKRVVFNVETMEIIIKEIPLRCSSSGVRL